MHDLIESAEALLSWLYIQGTYDPESKEISDLERAIAAVRRKSV